MASDLPSHPVDLQPGRRAARHCQRMIEIGLVPRHGHKATTERAATVGTDLGALRHRAIRHPVRGRTIRASRYVSTTPAHAHAVMRGLCAAPRRRSGATFGRVLAGPCLRRCPATWERALEENARSMPSRYCSGDHKPRVGAHLDERSAPATRVSSSRRLRAVSPSAVPVVRGRSAEHARVSAPSIPRTGLLAPSDRWGRRTRGPGGATVGIPSPW